MKRIVTFVLALMVLTAGAACARAEYFSEAALVVGEQVVTTEELETAMRRYQIQAALDCAALGYGYDVKDSLNIIDAMDKVIFDLEQRLVIQAQTAALEIPELTDEERAAAAEQAEQTWQSCLDIVNSENGRAYLPAGEEAADGNDPRSDAEKYLTSWGLTREFLAQEACDAMTEQKLMAAYAAQQGLTDATEDEQLDAYTEWILQCWQDVGVNEDALAVAEVCMKLYK